MGEKPSISQSQGQEGWRADFKGHLGAFKRYLQRIGGTNVRILMQIKRMMIQIWVHENVPDGKFGYAMRRVIKLR